ncbi:MAG TPA: RNA polymerase sigma factor [Pyrinomonadaceae bacterium]|nr:RNA polymerase sigma factor [Pyrinomonadaceae bacterium]
MHDEVIKTRLRTTENIPSIDVINTDAVTDETLVAAVIEGDDRAFAEIFERYKRSVTRTVARFFSDRSDIEEFVQQSFTKAYFSIRDHRGGEERSLQAWLARIAVNVCYDEFRRRKRKGETMFSALSTDESEFVETLVDQRARSADDRLVAKQLAEKVLGSLDPQDRVAVQLVYSEDFSLAEAAEMIGISTSNLKSRLFRCRNFIQKRFGKLRAS